MAKRWDAHEIRDYARALRRAAPEPARRMRSELRAIGRETVVQLKTAMPHKENASAAASGIRYSDALSANGAAIVVGGQSTPKSWAYAFAVGNKGPNQLWHKTYGHAYTLKKLQPTGTWYEDVMVRVAPSMVVRVEAVMAGVLAEIAGGSHI